MLTLAEVSLEERLIYHEINCVRSKGNTIEGQEINISFYYKRKPEQMYNEASTDYTVSQVPYSNHCLPYFKFTSLKYSQIYNCYPYTKLLHHNL